MDSDRVQVVQAVVDRLVSYQATAREGTIKRELRDALDAAGVSLGDGDVAALVEAVERADAPVDVGEVLGG